MRFLGCSPQDMTEDSVAVLNGLLREQVNFQYDMLLHAGDIVYADGEQVRRRQPLPAWHATRCTGSLHTAIRPLHAG